MRVLKKLFGILLIVIVGMVIYTQFIHTDDDNPFVEENDLTISENDSMILGYYQYKNKSHFFTICGETKAKTLQPKSEVQLNMLQSAFQNMLENEDDKLYLEIKAIDREDSIDLYSYGEFQFESNCE